MGTADSTWSIKVLDGLAAEDLQKVADFFNEYFPGVFYPKCTPEIFAWKLGANNPAGRGFLTVALADGKVVGTTSGTRRLLLCSGEQVPGMEIGDTFTHPDFRRQGRCVTAYPGTSSPDEYLNKSIFGRLVTETLDRARDAGVVHVYGTPNENSRPPYISRLGFTEIGMGKVRTWNSVKPSVKIGGRFSALIRCFALLLKVAQKVNSVVIKHRLKVDEISFEDLLLDRKRAPLQGNHALGLADTFDLAEDSAFLEHRYRSHPNYRYRYFRLRNERETLGLAIIVEVVRPSGRKTLVISDWSEVSPKFSQWVPAFLSLIGEKFPMSEVISAWIANGWVNSRAWYRFGFIGRTNVSVIYKKLSGPIQSEAQSFPNFRFGWSDNG